MKKMAEVFADIGENTHARERYAVDALQQSTLYTRLNNYAPLRRSRELLKSWVYRLAPILPTNPRYLEEQNFVSSHYLNLLGFDLSNQLNRIIENWRKNNHPLLDDVPARPSSAPLRAATVLRTPAGSAVPYLHANAILITDCPFQFIAAQRPQTPFVPAKKVSTALGLAQAFPKMFGQNAPAEAVPQTDNSVTFWQTILKEKVDVIVDLDDAKARPEAMPYGPSLNTQKEIGSHTLVVTTEHRQRNLRIEEIQARAANNPTSDVARLHFTGWPERNAIEPQALIDLARDVVLATQSYGPKVLVHSTRGSSRAGTLITFIAASEQVTSLLQGQRTMTPAALVDIVLKIIVRGRTERGPDFVDSAHIQLIFVALLKKHFVGVRGEPGAQDGELVAR